MTYLLQFVPYWHFYVRHPEPGVLVVTSPPHIVMFCVLMYLCYRVFWKNIRTELADGTANAGGVALMSVLTLLVFLLATPNASLRLDRQTQTATLLRFVCGIPYWKRIPFSEIERAGMRRAPGSNHFYLETKDEEYSLASWDGMTGQAAATNAVNDFLRTTPGTKLNQCMCR